MSVEVMSGIFCFKPAPPYLSLQEAVDKIYFEEENDYEKNDSDFMNPGCSRSA